MIAGSTVPTVSPRAIPQSETTLEAWDTAQQQGEPRFVPSTSHVDDRGWSLMNLFQHILSPQGQVNYSVMFPSIIKAWHRHQHQTDFWICLHGHLKVGVHRDDDDACWHGVIGDKRPGVVVIPPPLWHGAATVGPEPAGLLYYVSQQYNPQEPDEQRRAYDALANFPWGVQYR